MEPDTI